MLYFHLPFGNVVLLSYYFYMNGEVLLNIKQIIKPTVYNTFHVCL